MHTPRETLQREAVEATEDTDAGRRSLKRERDAAPPTPKASRALACAVVPPTDAVQDEGDEPKPVAGLTPLAKKNRVQPGKPSDSDTESVPAEEDEDKAKVTPPAVRPASLVHSSGPPTPIVLDKEPLPSEGRETRHIRQRVEALECDDPLAATAPAGSTSEDTEIADVAAEVAKSSVLVAKDEATDVELADVAAEVSQSAQVIDESLDKDAEIADVAAEVAETATALAKSDEKDMEVAEVASEVAVSAEMLANAEEEPADVAFVDAPLSNSIPASDPTPPASVPLLAPIPVAPSSFSAFSSTASPFAAVAPPSVSPFGAVSPTRPPTPPQVQKPKAKTSFAVPFVPLGSSSANDLPPPVTSSPVQPKSSEVPSAAGAHAPPATPLASKTFPSSAFTPTPSKPSTNSFSAFASTSGFGTVPKAASNSVFGALSTPSSSKLSSLAVNAFSTPGGGSGFGSYSASHSKVVSSAFATIQASDSPAPADGERKLGEPVEVDSSRRVFTEQEVVTGEEDEDTLHSVRCKLFAMTPGGWVERGTGLMKMNATMGPDRTSGIPRLVMRADATHRLLLNATLFSDFSISVSQEKYVCFAIIEGSEPISYMLRMSGAPGAQSFVQEVKDRVALIKSSDK